MGRLAVPETLGQDQENWLGQLAIKVHHRSLAWLMATPQDGAPAMGGDEVQQDGEGTDRGATDSDEARPKAAATVIERLANPLCLPLSM